MALEKFGPGCHWHGMYEQFGPANVKWCEETLCSVINEPANAWSNLGFIIAGFYFWNKHRKNEQTITAWLAMAGVIMGVFSFIYHSTNNAMTQYLDFFGMYVFELFIIAINVARLKGMKDMSALKKPYWLAVIGMTLVTPLFRQIGFPIQMLIFIAVIAIVATEYKCMKGGMAAPNYRNFLTSLAAFGVAITCSMLDVTRSMCDPQNHFVQGHAMWHVFSAIGMIFSIKHYSLIEVKGRLEGVAMTSMDTQLQHE